MGLLDAFNNDSTRFSLGLLAAAAPRADQAGFGQRVQEALAGVDASRAQKQRQELQKFQLDTMRSQAERDAKLAALPGQFMQPAIAPQEVTQTVPYSPDQQTALTQGKPASFDYKGYAGALAGIDPMAAFSLQNALNPAPKYETVAPGASLVRVGQDGTAVPTFTAPPIAKEAAPTDLARLIMERDRFPPGSPNRKMYDAAIAKATTHQPGVNVTYGAPVAGVDAKGNPVFFQPSKDGSPPSIVPGVAPPDKADPVEFNKSVAGLKELDNGLSSYEKVLKETGGVNPISLGSNRAALQSSYTTLQMGLKNAFELGALAGPDLELLQGMLVDPTSPRAMLVGDKGVAEQIKKARQYLKNRGQAVYEAHKRPVPSEYQQAPSTDDLVNKYKSK